MTTINIILYIIAQVIKTIAIIYMVNALYDFFFKGGHKNEDNNV